MSTLYVTDSSFSAFAVPVDTNTPRRLHPNRGEKACKMLFVKGIKSDRTNNTTTAYVGYENTATGQQFDIAAGEERVMYPPPGSNTLIDPYDIWVDSTTNADGVWWCAVGIPSPLAPS